MIHRRAILGFALLPGIALACSFCRFSLGPPTPDRPFELADLFLPKASLPELWNVDPTQPYEACSASPLGSGCPTHGERVTYYFPDGQWVSETIFQFLDYGLATQDFQDALSTEVWSSRGDQPWASVADLPARFPGASQQFIACRPGPIGRECALAAQYEEFVVIFMARPAILSAEDLALLASLIDERMTYFLRQGAPTQSAEP